ncbi:Phosphoglycerate mutase family [Weissella jogaejeotgali]|uniref:Phosphoglycerate mutase family n=2 Tax=Weissella TaxID=46255 RepID=A0A1L6RA28_9LACO|nr:histidine phosphatase family protein [Weissella jogaejeotgali]APS41409.1 Phosphoglycerate mutase family [Weissella jogaejeotgali]CCC56696.1 phosphoglycerate mutase [Weissella thailandensis fsh4-2]
MKTLHLYVVRHGKTYFNRYNKLQGWGNSPLVESGIKDAYQAGHKLSQVHFKAAYSSDTTRAMDTAKIILDENKNSRDISLITDAKFREEFYGSFEGANMDVAWTSAGAPVGLRTYAEIVDQYGVDKTKDLLKDADPWHDAENSEEYWQRVLAGLKRILTNPVLDDGDNVLLISHGNTLISLADRFGEGKIAVHERPANGSISQMELNKDGLSIITYNNEPVQD